MRSIPVDTNKIAFIGTGKAAARAEYVELSDGSRRRSGNQAKDQESGMPLWVVDVLVNDPEAERAEIAGVKVASWDEPKTALGQPVKFLNLVAVPYVDQRSNRVALSFRCDGIEGPQASQKAA